MILKKLGGPSGSIFFFFGQIHMGFGHILLFSFEDLLVSQLSKCVCDSKALLILDWCPMWLGFWLAFHGMKK